MHGRRKLRLGDFEDRATTKTYRIKSLETRRWNRRDFENLELVIAGVGCIHATFVSNEVTMQMLSFKRDKD